MAKIPSLLLVISFPLYFASAALSDEKCSPAMKEWAGWRGPLATGTAPKATPPTVWSEEKNVRWKVEIPGRGHATPIIWGDRIYIQTAVETSKDGAEAMKKSDDEEKTADVDEPRPQRRRARDPNEEGAGDRPMRRSRPSGEGGASSEERDGRRMVKPGDEDRPRRGPGRRGGFGGPRSAPTHLFEFEVVALDPKTGRKLWTKTVREERPHEGGHPDSSQASNSPVADGDNVYAYFGSRGLHCLSKDGDLKWEVDLGKMKTRNEFGEGSSPVLYDDTLVVDWDHEGDDFVVAFDKHTGKQKWKVARDEHTTWATPIIVEVKGKPQVVVDATNFIRAYDLETGKELWRCKGMTDNVIPSAMPGKGLLYAISGYRGASLLAIDYVKARGDITGTEAVVWKYDRDTPYVPSGVLYGGRIYFVENVKPLLSCLDATTGKLLYPKQRLSGIDSIYASLVGADGKVYVVGRNGTTIVLKDGESFEVAATNKLDDGFDASPAIVGDALYLRGRSHLYCIGESDARAGE